MYISEIRTKAPADERMPLERKFYDTLEKLKIPYEQVDNDPASSMEECAEVDKAIGTEIRKNVFLCNQKKTTFFLLVMPADKAFDTSSFSKKLGVSHMSFAPPEKNVIGPPGHLHFPSSPPLPTIHCSLSTYFTTHTPPYPPLSG